MYIKFLPHILYNYSYSAHQELFLILVSTVFVSAKNGEKIHVFFLSKNVRHYFIFAQIKNRMICAIAINILNLKPFDVFVPDNPSPRFHQQRTPIYFLRTYDSPPFSSLKSV